MIKRITVTQKDIDEGKAVDCDKCPIALAISRALGYHVSVTRSLAFIRGNEKFNAKIPDEVGQFIRYFDLFGKDNGWSTGTIKPFTFELDIQS